jgi:nicotinate-nucleotide adenylyltransferase
VKSYPRIALFGGTFDPIHIGHLAVARQAYQQLKLDRVIFIPSGTPPHRATGPVATAEQRCAMVELAIAKEPNFELSDLEARREGLSYTVDTVRTFAQTYPDASLYFILGDDCAAKLHRWKGIEEMLTLVTFIAAHRGGGKADAAVAHRVVNLEMEAMPQASTYLRAALANGQTIEHDTASVVARFISEQGLYRNPLSA